MNIELILFGVIAFVLVLDFVLRGWNKNKTQDDIERIGEKHTETKLISLNYFGSRKRNIMSFILLSILLKPVFVFLVLPNYSEHINYELKIERESFIDDKIILLNTYPTTRIGITDKPNVKGFYFKKFPKNSNRYKGVYGHDSLQLVYEYYVKNRFNISYAKRGDWNWYDAIGRSKNSTLIDSLVEKDGKVKFIDFDKIPSKNEMIECCNIYLDFESDNFFDKNGNQLLHIEARMFGDEVTDNKFYFYPLIKKVDSFRNHFKETFKSKQEFFGVTFVFTGILVFLFNDKIKAR